MVLGIIVGMVSWTATASSKRGGSSRLHEFVRFQDAEAGLTRAFADYNNDRMHSALGHVTSNVFARKSGEWE